MQSNRLPAIIRWWVTPKLPDHYIFILPDKRPKGLYQIIRVYFRKWTVHPIKRWVAHFYVRLLQKFFGLTVIGITGSSGKTTTKEMLASILRQKGETVSSHANIDPVFNIPTTILKARPTIKYLILEMGVEFPNEMAFYLWLAQPKIGVVTNVYQTHTAFFDDTSGVAQEKEVLIKSLETNDIAVLNKDNTYTRQFGKFISSKIVWFGKTGFVQAINIKITSDLNTKYILFVGKQSIVINLPTLGEQFVENSLAAAATAWACGATIEQIKQGLELFTPTEHRMRPIKLKNGALVLDDSYNSNPQAAKEALKTLKQVAENLPAGRQVIAVLGDMLELGKDEVERHKELGRFATRVGVNHLIGVGPLSKHTVEAFGGKQTPQVHPEHSRRVRAYSTPGVGTIMPLLKPLLKKNTAVLIKGSRSIGLEKVVEKLQNIGR